MRNEPKNCEQIPENTWIGIIGKDQNSEGSEINAPRE